MRTLGALMVVAGVGLVFVVARTLPRRGTTPMLRVAQRPDPPPPPALTPAETEQRRRLVSWMLGAAALAIIVGSFLPWMTLHTGFISITRNGVEGGGDGVTMLVAGVLIGIIALVLLSGREQGHMWIGAALLGAVAVVVALANISDINDRAEAAETAAMGNATANVGAGLYLILIGASVVIGSAVAMRRLP